MSFHPRAKRSFGNLLADLIFASACWPDRSDITGRSWRWGWSVQRFQNLNVVPRRISAEFSTNDLLHIEVDVFGLTDEQLSLVAGKIGLAVSICHVHWHRLA
jgi:hypothetical protein